ncbi:MAG: IS1096 element passenger TnpR family protein [Bacteroidota bacterium]
MAVYRFRITFEDYDDISRDVEIRSIQSFEDLHHSIHSAIGFDGSKSASFFMSDDHWTKGKEFTNRELTEEEKETIKPFRRSRLCDFISDPHQKIYYVFDPDTQWAFRIELIKILAAEEIAVSYPRCTKVNGEAPKQYGNVLLGALPVPEDFDPSMLLDDDEDLEADIESENEEVVVATAEEVSDMGELDTNEGEESSEDFEPAEDEMMDQDSQENEEF